MKDEKYVIFDRNGMQGMRTGKPHLSAGQFAFKIRLEVENKYFDRVIPVADLKLDESHILQPEVEVEQIPLEPETKEKK